MTDVTVENHGTLFLFFVHTSAAVEWIKQWVDEDFDLTTSPLVVEHRFAQDIAAGMVNDGLELV